VTFSIICRKESTAMILCLGPTPTVQRTMMFVSLTLDAVNRATQVREFASGKSTNVARVLHTLGEKVKALGVLGGQRGEFFRSDLDRSGIAHDFVQVQAPTRLCTTVIDQAGKTATELLEESSPLESQDYEVLLESLKRHLKDAKLLVISGTLPPSAKADFYARCVELAQPKVPVILDAVGAPLLEALRAHPFIVKPNQSEIGRTLGIDTSTDEGLHQGMIELISRGAKWVIATRGRNATLVTDGKSFWQLNTPAVQVISAIGSGDSFAAGLAAGLVQGNEVPEACKLAVACGAANAMTPDAGHIDMETVKSLLAQISPSPHTTKSSPTP
jgi:tagatose 6-phosphate kinase